MGKNENRTRILDWKPRHDEASRAYPIRSVIGTDVIRGPILWAPGPILDQGREGACVGHGFTNEATADPIPVDFAAVDLGDDDLGQPWPTDPQAFAFAFYEWCKRHDPYPGTNYDGTAVLTGAKGMQALGFIPEFRWAFGTDDVIDTLCGYGPVVLGIEWREDMYEAPGGELRATGQVVGGHCILAIGYDPARKWADGSITPAVALVNSWGPSWGIDGVAWVSVTDLGSLLARQGEACVPMSRAYGPTSTPVAPKTCIGRLAARVRRAFSRSAR